MESLWGHIYRVIRKQEKPGGYPTSNRLGPSIKSKQVGDPGETFFPDDRVDTDDPYHTESWDTRAWKVAAIKVIQKPGKDYARPKSYRPIGLLCAGQNSGKDAGRAPQWHNAKLQATYGFTPQPDGGCPL
ncbi:hypothetical protein EVAR_91655_1 [Eumeta japonica]|uniref:Uncharacterized protein n=1 Tax=Eumeta variegata TaxID=151549 RepID=A0A4C1Z4G4_EUMVA|nr:hypothetical protein EVAR_91655_1 [Eumeta japonica]